MRRVVRNKAHRLAFDTHQGRHHAVTEIAAQFEHRACVANAVDDRADIIDTQTVFRNHMTQHALVGTFPVGNVALKIGEIFFGGGNGFHFIFDQYVDDTIGRLHGDRSDFIRREDAKTAAFNHGRSAHADVGIFGRDDDIGAPEQSRIARKATA